MVFEPMTPTEPASWSQVLEYIRARTKPPQYQTWFPALLCTTFSKERVSVGAPNDFYRKWVENHYLGLLREACFMVLDAEPMIELSILPASPEQGRDAGQDLSVNAHRSLVPPPPVRSAPASRALGDVPLKPQYVFDTFVVGSSNRLANAAALAVTENPAHAYNPLFIHGGVGLGKTHLLQAICHATLAKNTNATLVYLSCEAFVNQYIATLQRGGDPDAFRQRYRHVDLLLVDDIHFLSSKKQMQEEFFHTFNTLYNAQKQIVLSSDSTPQDIPDIEARLVSRFKWGLVAEIEPPHYETKVAIIKAKAKARGHDLPEDVVDFLANSLDSNIRELEGAVTKIIVLAGVQNQKIDISLCRVAVKELASLSGQVNLSDIMTLVATNYHLKVHDLLSKKRTKSIALPRQICMYLARMLTTLSLDEIGGQFGGRDHTTVLYAEGKIRDLREKSPETRAILERLSRELRRS